MAVEEPKLRGVRVEELRIGCFHETELVMPEHGVVSPESFVSSEIRET